MAGANGKLTHDKGTWCVTAPGLATIHRRFEDLAVRCDKEGMPPGRTTVKSSTKAMPFGNIIFGGVIGAGVDMASGADYDHPTLGTVEMGETVTLAPPPQAAAESSSAGAAAPAKTTN